MKKIIDVVSMKKEILLATLILMVLVVLGTAAYGQSEKKTDKQQEANQINLLNPFTLEIAGVSEVKTNKSSSVSTLLSESVYVTPQIQIPYRPTLRSAFRPSL